MKILADSNLRLVIGEREKGWRVGVYAAKITTHTYTG